MKKKKLSHALTCLMLAQCLTLTPVINAESQWLLTQKNRITAGIADVLSYGATKTKLYAPQVCSWIHKHCIPLSMATFSAVFLIWAYWPKMVKTIICNDFSAPVPSDWQLQALSPNLHVQIERTTDNMLLVSYAYGSTKMTLFHAEYKAQFSNASDPLFSPSNPAFMIKTPHNPTTTFICKQNTQMFNLLNQN